MKVKLTEQQFRRIFLREQQRRTIDTTKDHTNDFETTKHLMGKGNYKKSSLDQCGYYAIERFEENYGDKSGNSMGAPYFEGNYERFDDTIIKRINSTLPLLWGTLGPKEKMQLWSFMYNSDSAANDQNRWLSVIYQTALGNTVYDNTLAEQIIKNSYTEGRRGKIVTDKNSPDYGKKKVDPTKVTYDKGIHYSALTYLNDSATTKSYPMNTLIKMIDGQYQALGQGAKYSKTWSYRPKFLNIMYDECMSNIDYGDKTSKPITAPTIGKKSITSKGSLSNFLSTLRKKTIDKTIDLDNVSFTFIDINNQKLEYKEDPNGTKVERLALALSLRGQACESCESIMVDFPSSEVLFKGTFSCVNNECRSWELIAIIP